ncbi:hypothetical protein AC579_6458 [Pseudocercospora musae]|uniref:Uncharacterized protein n=1 Tax=Pseudocercospora musae TaxID=113226 RepID=A0A139IKD6_9PEZI|nr:hypothetical protein AC579_6458 [Pseudocercospora musae]
MIRLGDNIKILTNQLEGISNTPARQVWFARVRAVETEIATLKIKIKTNAFTCDGSNASNETQHEAAVSRVETLEQARKFVRPAKQIGIPWLCRSSTSTIERVGSARLRSRNSEERSMGLCSRFSATLASMICKCTRFKNGFRVPITQFNRSDAAWVSNRSPCLKQQQKNLGSSHFSARASAAQDDRHCEPHLDEQWLAKCEVMSCLKTLEPKFYGTLNVCCLIHPILHVKAGGSRKLSIELLFPTCPAVWNIHNRMLDRIISYLKEADFGLEMKLQGAETKIRQLEKRAPKTHLPNGSKQSRA